MIAIIDYHMGNAQSVINAMASLGAEAILTSKDQDIRKASHLILPGVGAFPKAMANLKELGVIELLTQEVLVNKKPFLGICLGMQVLAETGYEAGITKGLGWIKGDVVRLNIESKGFKVPHVGWDDITCNTASPMFANLAKPTQTFYFVHSYYLNCADQNIVSGYCDYGIKFPAAIQKENIWGAQFHPEKSQEDGLALLKRFLDYKKPQAK